MQSEHLFVAAVKDLEQQRGKQTADECDDRWDTSISDAEDAGASHQLVLRCCVDATVPDSGRRQKTGDQYSQTDELMDSSTSCAL